MCSFCIFLNLLCHFSTRFLKNRDGRLYFPSRLYNRVCIISTFYRGWIKCGCTTALVSLIHPRLNIFFLLVFIAFFCTARKANCNKKIVHIRIKIEFLDINYEAQASILFEVFFWHLFHLFLTQANTFTKLKDFHKFGHDLIFIKSTQSTWIFLFHYLFHYSFSFCLYVVSRILLFYVSVCIMAGLIRLSYGITKKIRTKILISFFSLEIWVTSTHSCNRESESYVKWK